MTYLMIRLAFKNIKENFKWALMTASGIMISLMLITMVISFASGANEAITKELLKDEERWNLQLSSVIDYQGVIDSSDAIESYLVRSYYGETMIKAPFPDPNGSSDQMYGIPVYNFKIDSDFFNHERVLENISFINEGRAPQDQGEIVLTDKLRTKEDGTDYVIGDIFGFVNYDGVYEEFTVVGFSAIEFSQVSDYDYKHDVRLTLEFKKGTKNFDSLTQDIIDLSQGKAEFNTRVNNLSGFSQTKNPIFLSAIILSSIIIVVISLSSIGLIYNAFNLSLEQKIDQIGLIQSIGATKKQISLMVYTEGFLISAMGITFGIIGGFLLAKMSLWYLGTVFYQLSDMLLFFTPRLSPRIIVLIYIVGFISVLLPIRKSVKNANKQTAIESIRRLSKDDTKIKYKSAPKLAKKIFGVSGDLAYKNRKRDKHRYRGTAVALITTSVLFISIASFLGYGREMIAMSANTNIDLLVHESTSPVDTKNTGYQIYDFIKNNVDVDDYLRYERIYFNVEEKDAIPVTQELENHLGYSHHLRINVVLFEDETYQTLFPTYDLNETVLLNHSKGKLYSKFGPVLINHQLSDLKSGASISGIIDEKHHDFTIDHVIMTPPHHHYPVGDGNELTVFISKSYGDSNLVVGSEPTFYRGNYVTSIQSEKYQQIEHELNEIITLYEDDWYANGYEALTDNVKEHSILLFSLIGSLDAVVKLVIVFIALICISNVLNVIVSTMRQRRSENAILRSVGLSVKHLRYMLILESIMGSILPLLFGTVLGIAVSRLMHFIASELIPLGEFSIAWEAVFLSWLMILVVTLVNAFVSLKTQGESAIIESIRSNNL